MIARNAMGNEIERRVAERYRQEGYTVITHPDPEALPFDLGSYQPDLLVSLPNGERYLVEVKNPASTLDVERLREVAQTVADQPGWRFFVVTDAAQLPIMEGIADSEPLPLAQIRSRLQRVDNLVVLGEAEGAYLTLWSLLEAVLRRKAEEVQLPLERLDTSTLVNHLYSQGELSIEQFDVAMELRSIRNTVAHGFAAPNVLVALPKLRGLVEELVDLWWPD